MSATTKPKKLRSKFFRIALEGDTSDGREIERHHLIEMAETYNPALYGARIWIEHFRSLLPDGPFPAQGDVVALKAEEVELKIGGETQKKMALFAQIEPTNNLVRMVNDLRQKVFSSMELAINFAKTGKAYLTGLAVTDTPASLGTEMLAFAQQHPDASPLKARKQHPDNLFTAFSETNIEFEEVEAAPGIMDALFSRLEALLGKRAGDEQASRAALSSQEFTQLRDAVTAVADHVRQQEERFNAAHREDADLRNLVQNISVDFAALRTKLESTPDPSQSSRPPVAGPDIILTDC